MYMKLLMVLGFISALTANSAFADRPANLQPVPEPPPPPNQLQSGEAIPLGEPQITIYQRGGDLIREYRLNGHLYAVKITPARGVPYYLIDADGDGHMEGQFLDDLNSKIIAPQWVLHRW
jgi:hypothetical protein